MASAAAKDAKAAPAVAPAAGAGAGAPATAAATPAATAAAAACACDASAAASAPASAAARRHPKIDLHTHILPESIPDFRKRFGYGDFITLEPIKNKPHMMAMMKGGERFRDIESNCYRAEPRLTDSDSDGVCVQVLSTVPVMFSYWAKPQDTLAVCEFLNDHIASLCAKHPRRFVGLATLPMQAPELAVKELERCVRELGLVGVQIGSHIEKWPLSEPKLNPVWAAAQELNACVFVHPWDMVGQELMRKYWLPWLVGMPAETSFAMCSLIFGGVMERFPRLRFGFAHGGGSFPGTIARIEHGFKCRPDLVAIDNATNPRDYFGRFWVDSLVHDPDTLKSVLKLVGEDFMFLGSDYPFPLGEAHPGAMVEGMDDLTDVQKRKILWDNGLAFCGLKSDRFVAADAYPAIDTTTVAAKAAAAKAAAASGAADASVASDASADAKSAAAAAPAASASGAGAAAGTGAATPFDAKAFLADAAAAAAASMPAPPPALGTPPMTAVAAAVVIPAGAPLPPAAK